MYNFMIGCVIIAVMIIFYCCDISQQYPRRNPADNPADILIAGVIYYTYRISV